MKKTFAIMIFAVIVIFSGCAQKEVKIEGIYSYNADFFTKQQFSDPFNIDKGDTTVFGGSINVNWNIITDIKAKNLFIEKAVGSDTLFENPMMMEFVKEGSVKEKMEVSGDYFYKLLADNSDVTTVKAFIPEIKIISPAITDKVKTKDILVAFNSVQGAQSYSITLKNLKEIPVWERVIVDTTAAYDGEDLVSGVYTLYVTTSFNIDSISTVKTQSAVQFVVE